MADKFSNETKQRAVAEVILGVASLTRVAERYRMSAGSLSILCSRFWRSIGGNEQFKENTKRLCVQQTPFQKRISLDLRVKQLEKSVEELYRIMNS